MFKYFCSVVGLVLKIKNKREKKMGLIVNGSNKNSPLNSIIKVISKQNT